MERDTIYTVTITSIAEIYFREVLSYFYRHLSIASADRKSTELLKLAMGLEKFPMRGRIEENLRSLGYNHRFILYFYTSVKAIKIIYYIDEEQKIVYITDFFPCQSHERKMSKR